MCACLWVCVGEEGGGGKRNSFTGPQSSGSASLVLKTYICSVRVEVVQFIHESLGQQITDNLNL